MLVISSSCSAQVCSSRRSLLLHRPTQYFPMPPSQEMLSEPTLALMSPRMMSLSALGTVAMKECSSS